MKYSDVIYGRAEKTLTIFVPWDCDNSCKFCTTKHEYNKIHSEEIVMKNLENICTQLLFYISSGFFTHIVFTGGEPFNNLSGLNRIIKTIKTADPTHKINIYINTTLSFKDSKLDDVLKWILNNKNDINGISISRPLGNGSFYKNENTILQTIEFGMKHGLDAFSEIKKNRIPLFRLNAYVNGIETEVEIKKYLDRWTKKENSGKYFFKEISFRSDYTITTPETLHSFNDKFFKTIIGMKSLEYLGSTQCLVCHTDLFKDTDREGLVIYHRGIRTTSILFGKKLIINDFVMKQNGDVFWDWEGGVLTSVDKNKQVLNELFKTT